MLTIESHTTTPDGDRLVVRVPHVAPEALSGVAGDACWAPAEGDATPTDTLHTTEWAAGTDPEAQRRDARLLIEAALRAPAPAPVDPAPLTAPGTEL
jgi:hypothetical protein